MFYEDGFEKIEEIKKCLDTGDLQLYATHVHGLKSAAASIGAEQLSIAAKALETAGKDNNLVYIRSHNPKFLMDLETILRGIGKALDKFNRQYESETGGLATEELRAELVKLRAALDGFDSAAIDEAANALQKYTHHADFGATAKSISQNVLIGEYDEAVAQIDELLKETALKETGAFEM
jgi:HPt (histidine-containing phosphotransfer) domain-containing protein